MFKFHFATVFAAVSMVFLISEIPRLCDSCQSAFGTFQEILQSRQQYGKLPRKAAMQLSRKRVFTKMECLDICLRNTVCDFFEVRHFKLNNTMKPQWVCDIKRRLTSIGTKPASLAHGWIHYNVTSHNLQKVSVSVGSLKYKKK